MALIIPNISEVSEKLEEYEEELKPTAHGRFLSFKTESFNFWSFRDTICRVRYPKTKIFVVQRQSLRLNMLNLEDRL